MTTSGTFAPDVGALFSLLDAGSGPVLVLDPCGALWDAFWQTPRWKNLWQAWRFAPGQAQEGDVWDVLSALRQVDPADGATAVAAALFPADCHSDLTRRLMTCVVAFADDTGHFTGRAAGLGALAGQLWAGDIWSSIARWSRQYPHHPALQTARALLTLEGASASVLAIRNRMEIFHHPHVAETFTGASGFRLSTLRQRPGQVIFLTPDIRCMESEDLTSVYRFLASALQAMAALHHVTFSLVEPGLTAEGEPL
ncbi:prepilin peptidase-dependent protein [Cedecea sp. P7760]|uniref:prepilin peptidase-dependent protein n=1 Tax=Cedecea sp. P7760 TaxID=2726983 RepID=UPI0015A1EC3B|nr:prepilin peptidase-dependent protein [Cedecea sp. P7760]NWC63947.1 prepilin peptidase-dependent protein [Cedecea sp. P7760]